MRWTIKRVPPPFRRWFAWHPITIGDERIWLEWVERQFESVCDYVYVNYRLIDGTNGREESSASMRDAG